MAGGHMKFRTLSRKSSHRQALLRNLVTSLIEHESITTSYAKAKEAQRFAEKLITLAKRNSNAAKNRAQGVLFRPAELMPKLFGEIRERYANRPGGYTRVLHIEPHKEDQAPSAILELVDGPKDMRFAMTARAIAAQQDTDEGIRDLTAKNIIKVTRHRPNGEHELQNLVRRMKTLEMNQELRSQPLEKRKVYHRRAPPWEEGASLS